MLVGNRCCTVGVDIVVGIVSGAIVVNFVVVVVVNVAFGVVVVVINVPFDVVFVVVLGVGLVVVVFIVVVGMPTAGSRQSGSATALPELASLYL